MYRTFASMISKGSRCDSPHQACSSTWDRGIARGWGGGIPGRDVQFGRAGLQPAQAGGGGAVAPAQAGAVVPDECQHHLVTALPDAHRLPAGTVEGMNSASVGGTAAASTQAADSAASGRPSSSSTPPAVELRGLRKTFRGKRGPITAVDGVDLTVGHGQIVAFLGPNGAGKTTTLDMVLGLVEPDGGQVRVMGMKPRAAVQAGRVSALLQTGGLLRDLTVAETVRYIASTFQAPRPADEVLTRAGLHDLGSRRVSKCSGGEQQRLRFALALLPDPDLLILDEPTAGLDVSARREFWDTMRTEASAGRSVVFATHYLEEAENFAERIVMISGGRIVADGSVSEIRERNSGRTLSVDLPEHGALDLLADLHALPGVTEVRPSGRRVFLRARDTDAAAVALLQEVGASGLEIASADLESAFVALTGTAPAESRLRTEESR